MARARYQIVALVGALVVGSLFLLSGMAVSRGLRPGAHSSGGLAPPAAAAAPALQASLAAQEQAGSAQEALLKCQSDFQDYAQAASASVKQCNANIEVLNDHVSDIDKSLKDCQARLSSTAGAAVSAECPPPPPPEVKIVEKVVEVEKPGSGGDGGRGKPWIVFGIPTVPRLQDRDYLSATIDFILDQLPADKNHPLYGKVLLYVMNHAKNGKPHPVFEANKQRLDPRSHPKGVYVKFAVNTEPPRVEVNRLRHDSNVPNNKVQQQSADVVTLVRAAAPLGQYYMFMEDDFRLCPRGMGALQDLLAKAHRHFPDWIVLRVGFGLNGALLKSADALEYARYLNDNIARRPPDHMLVEWFAGEKPRSAAYKGSRPHIAFRYNLFEHLGDYSTLRSTKAPQHAACYEQLLAPVLFEVEAFKPAECRHTDMWPCPAPGREDEPVMGWDRIGTKVTRVKHLPAPH